MNARPANHKGRREAQNNTPKNIQKTLHTRSYFYVGGSYVQSPIGSSISAEQMYVEHLTPIKVTARYPLLMIHGNGMTGTNFLNTPDGRPGWADYFMAQGYELYIVDQASRARSPWQQTVDGQQSMFDTLTIEKMFTATQRFDLWPNAHLHTQWVGNGSRGDPTFDSFYASIVPSLASAAEASQKTHNGVVALLDSIGSAILMTHSQSGQYGWSIADARPSLVKAIVALEPIGPPFKNAVFPPFALARPFGLTEIPVHYDPPIASAADLKTEIVSSSPNFTCIQQVSPSRQLANLLQTPVLVLTSQSGYHSVYDDCSVDFLRRAGVPVEHVSLGDVGILGNGHMMFMEKNNVEIADRVVSPWLQSI
ncbi:hypothetical protein HYPSUDRAFT_68131 [Hypholoma sublateritium FD-334 SS-4]|uniref:Uncharacterized protein n=1 Tax=Hypholoma sublateritium (strain FD-334 SS-4) TaxID=945553 RepID=A0A0D2PMA0_HYPSF|nr:hypothetical protein HYPSUDRAFT_68131 [Hypholoma sublateritium FD-334 SS-4]